jgi:tetratricopeptide (TPR) repeat protein
MDVRVLTFFAASALFAADEQRAALALRAQTDYERVFLAAAPALRDTNACIQSVAAMIPVATPEELPLYHFQKGWCTLAMATITKENGSYQQAATEFDQAGAAWAGRNAAFTKKKAPTEPAPSVFPVLAAVARLNSGATEAKEVGAAVAAHSCPFSVVPPQRCEPILQAGRQWLGYLDLRRDDLDAAARDFPASAAGWTNWVAGKQAFRDRKYPDAAADYRRAVDAFDAQANAAVRPLLDRIAPPMDLSAANAELAGAQLLAGDTKTAIATLNRALQIDPANARALFLRGRARDVAGQADAAVADYSLAARSALAQGSDDAFGESHLYRGISFYRRKDYQKAEDEFSDALNFELPASMRADAVAWRRLAAVASGSCEAGRKYLEEALPTVSPFFPREEARATMASCVATANAARPEVQK